MSKRAIVLAGGKGARLRPYTISLPKPLIPIGDLPILEVVIRQLASFGFDHITIAVNHLAEIIKAFCGDGSKWNVRIDFSVEDRALSTMGPLHLIPNLPENFLVMNGDVLTDLDFSQFYSNHIKRGSIFTVSAQQVKTKSEYGVLKINEKSLLSGFEEKPVTSQLVSMGVYMASRKILEVIPKNLAYGFDNLMIDLMAHNQPAYVQTFEGYWLDIGRHDDYERAVEEFDKNKHILLKGQF